MMEPASLRRITDALLSILEDRVPDIPWKVSIMGATFPKKLTGFIICDEVRYSPYDKDERIAEATFGLQIICPNARGDTNTTVVEDYAMAVRNVLAEEYRLDDWAQDSYVESIVFGTAKGVTNIGTAVITYIVKYEEE